MKTVYVVRIYGLPQGAIYVGKGSAKIERPQSYQLMKFANEFGFATEQEAIQAPVSYYFDKKATKAEVIQLEVC